MNAGLIPEKINSLSSALDSKADLNESSTSKKRKIHNQQRQPPQPPQPPQPLQQDVESKRNHDTDTSTEKRKKQKQSDPPRLKLFSFDERLAQLITYKEEHGNCLIRTQNFGLGNWVKTQRKEYKKWKHDGRKSTMTEERYKKLVDIGFVFNVPDYLKNKKGSNRSLTTQNHHTTISKEDNRINKDDATVPPEVGDQVYHHFTDGYWYFGKVTKKYHKEGEWCFLIEYDDGDVIKELRTSDGFIVTESQYQASVAKESMKSPASCSKRHQGDTRTAYAMNGHPSQIGIANKGIKESSSSVGRHQEPEHDDANMTSVILPADSYRIAVSGPSAVDDNKVPEAQAGPENNWMDTDSSQHKAKSSALVSPAGAVTPSVASPNTSEGGGAGIRKSKTDMSPSGTPAASRGNNDSSVQGDISPSMRGDPKSGENEAKLPSNDTTYKEEIKYCLLSILWSDDLNRDEQDVVSEAAMRLTKPNDICASMLLEDIEGKNPNFRLEEVADEFVKKVKKLKEIARKKAPYDSSRLLCSATSKGVPEGKERDGNPNENIGASNVLCSEPNIPQNRNNVGAMNPDCDSKSNRESPVSPRKDQQGDIPTTNKNEKSDPTGLDTIASTNNSNMSGDTTNGLLAFLQTHASCLKNETTPASFHHFLVSEDILSLSDLADSFEDMDYHKTLQSNGLKGFKFGRFLKAVKKAAGLGDKR